MTGEIQPVIEGSVQKPDGTLQILGGEGQPLTVTCLSDHNPIYLMYNDTQYNNSVLFNGSYSVNFTIQATRDDDGENVSCHLVNSTSGEKIIVFASIYLKCKFTCIYNRKKNKTKKTLRFIHVYLIQCTCTWCFVHVHVHTCFHFIKGSVKTKITIWTSLCHLNFRQEAPTLNLERILCKMHWLGSKISASLHLHLYFTPKNLS